MKRSIILWVVAVIVWGLFVPPNCPAPLIWRKGDGWSYERAGAFPAITPKDQLEQGRQFQAKGQYGDAISAYRRLLKRWLMSDAAQEAQLRLAECYAAKGYHHRAFQEYQALIEKHPNIEQFDTVLQRQFQIGNLFLNGERDKAWGIRWFSSPEKAISIFEQIVKNGPYSTIAPNAQFHVGLTHEKQKNYVEAVLAYEKLLERYPQHAMAEMAQFQIGSAYLKEAKRAEYDQNAADQAIAAFTEFTVRYPNSGRIADATQHLITLKQEQSRGLFHIGEFYEKHGKTKAALIYYNEVLERNSQSNWAIAARNKLVTLSDAPKTR